MHDGSARLWSWALGDATHFANLSAVKSRSAMGNTSFLTGGSSNGPGSFEEAVFQLENTSTIFLAAWQRVPPDHHRAGRVSIEAMTYLDHIVNEILRARDALKAQGTYATSPLKVELDVPLGLAVRPVSRAQQQALGARGPGNGALPATGAPITFEKLLNKIKHRQHGSGNFRVDPINRHIFLISVDKPNQSPDSIVEFDVATFCSHCNVVAPLL